LEGKHVRGCDLEAENAIDAENLQYSWVKYGKNKKV
jgi:hypothetical protein